MDDPGKIAVKFLNELNSNKDSFDTLLELVELLERKNDPDSTEIRLVHNIYNFLEQFRTLEHNVKSYTKNEQKTFNKLELLYGEMFQDENIYRD